MSLDPKRIDEAIIALAFSCIALGVQVGIRRTLDSPPLSA